jgi:DNA-binding MarR family transcriptional regulator
MLGWIGRFRYTSVELLALRFGVAAQNVRVRLKRLETAGLVRMERRSRCEPWVVSITGAGAAALGQPRRKAPRVDLHQAHELAIGWLCARIETSPAGASLTVVTEREMRSCDHARKREHLRQRYRLELRGIPRGDRSRWPDLVVERDGELRRAIEIEFTHKATARLEAIVERYINVGPYPQVTYLTADPALAAKLITIAANNEPDTDRVLEPVRLEVRPWPGADESTRACVATRIEATQRALGLTSEHAPGLPY